MFNDSQFSICEMDISEAKVIADFVNLAYLDVQQEFFGGLPRTDLAEVQGVFAKGIWLGAYSIESNRLLGVGAMEFSSLTLAILSKLATLQTPEAKGLGILINLEHIKIAIAKKINRIEFDVVGKRDEPGPYEAQLLARSLKLGFILESHFDFCEVYTERAQFQKLPLKVLRFSKQL